MFFMDFALKAEKDVFSEITEAENLLLAREKALKTKTLTDYKPLQEDANLEAEFVQALLARIRFSRVCHPSPLGSSSGALSWVVFVISRFHVPSVSSVPFYRHWCGKDGLAPSCQSSIFLSFDSLLT